MNEDEGRKTINTAAEFLEAAAQACAVAHEPAEEGEEDFAAVGRLQRSMTKVTANCAATLEAVVASVPRVDFPSVSMPELEHFTEMQKAVTETLARVFGSVPKVHFPTVSPGRLDGFVEFQRVMDAYQRRWQSLARQILPPVKPRRDLSAVAASVPLPRPAATRDEVAALKQRVIAGEQRHRVLEQETIALKQRVVALEVQRIFPDDPDFPH